MRLWQLGVDRTPRIIQNRDGNCFVPAGEATLPHRSIPKPYLQLLTDEGIKPPDLGALQGTRDFHRHCNLSAEACLNSLAGSEVLPP